MYINYRIMEKADIASVVTCLTDAFTQSEPMTSFLKINKSDFSVFAEINCMAVYEDKLSIIAEIDKKIVGARLTSRYKKTNLIAIKIPPHNVANYYITRSVAFKRVY